MKEGSSIFGILKGINLNKILNTANKTLNFVNKAIPMYKEIKPTMNSIKKMVSSKKEEVPNVVDEIKESRPIKIKKDTSSQNIERSTSNDTLTFFQ